MPPTPSTVPGSPPLPHRNDSLLRAETPSGRKAGDAYSAAPIAIGGLDADIALEAHHIVHWQAGVRRGIPRHHRSRLTRPKHRSARSNGRMVLGRCRCRRPIKASPSRFYDGFSSSGSVAQLCSGNPRLRKQTAAKRPLRCGPRSDQSIIMGVRPLGPAVGRW